MKYNFLDCLLKKCGKYLFFMTFLYTQLLYNAKI